MCLLRPNYSLRNLPNKKELILIETFSPDIRYESVCFLIAVAASKRFQVHQMDVSTAFLHGDIDAEIHMKQPPVFQ